MLKVKRKRNIYWRMVLYIVLTIGSGICILPFVWMGLFSFSEVFRFELIPTKLGFKNYIYLFSRMPIIRFYWNSIVVVSISVILGLFIQSLAAYSFARRKFPGRDALFLFILANIMIPFDPKIIPLYTIIAKAHLMNSYAALIAPRLAVVFGFFLLRQHMLKIPLELEEAARLDGCSEFQIYYRIILPVIKPTLTALCIFQSMLVWNDFLWPLVVITEMETTTILFQ